MIKLKWLEVSQLLEIISGFLSELRAWGLPISLTESIDVGLATMSIGLFDRQRLRYTLGACVVKSPAHRAVFDKVFDIWFSLPSSSDISLSAPDQLATTEQGSLHSGALGTGYSPEEFGEMLFEALLSGDDSLIRRLASDALNMYAGMEAGRPVAGVYYFYRTLRNLNLDGVLAELMNTGFSEAKSYTNTLQKKLLQEDYRIEIEKLKKEIQDEITRRLVADRGVQALAASQRTPLPENLDFMNATSQELAQLRRILSVVARKIATRLARKRRSKKSGPLDFRSTIRHSMSYGGAPVVPRFHHRSVSKPEIFVLADVSGSVASFARFTLQLVYALNSQFSKVRAFAFIDGIDEVTKFFEKASDVAEAIRLVNTKADIVWVDGHSDYGHAFTVFQERWGKDISPKTTVLVLGDARSNYHTPQAWVLKEIQSKAKHLWWLNPEPRAYWRTGDSVIGEYETYCEKVFECRNLTQLENFAEHLE